MRFCNEIVIAVDQLHPKPSFNKYNNNRGIGSNNDSVKGTRKDKDKKEKGSIKKGAQAKLGDDPEGPKVCHGITYMFKIITDSNLLQPNEKGFLTFPFSLDLGTSAPPSVRLLPCRPYSGAPIGTTYEVQLFAGIVHVYV